MKISVLIPAYNEEKYLPRTLSSLHNLDRQPDQILVVDGSSTDKTRTIARQNGAEVLKVDHKGIGYARQMGLQHATGDVVAYTDADTVVPKDWLSKIEQSFSDSRVSCVFGTFRVRDGWWQYRMHVNYVQPVLHALISFFGIPMAPGQNIALKRDVALAAGGFPVDFKICEDIEMARRMKRYGRIRFRHDLVVTSSGRRGNEGLKMYSRVFRAFLYYFVFRKADVVGFPDER